MQERQLDADMTRLESGLVVPKDVAAQVIADHRVKSSVTAEDWRNWQRTFRAMLQFGIDIAFICCKCQHLFKNENRDDGQSYLVCNCREIRLRPVVQPARRRR